MKQLIITTIAAVVLVGCGESQQTAPSPESKPVEPVAKAAKPEPPTVEAPDISISEAALNENIEAVKQHIAAGTDVNARDDQFGGTPLLAAAMKGHKEVAELLIDKGADVNARDFLGMILVDVAIWHSKTEEKSPQTTPPSKYQNGIKYNRSVTVTYTLL